MVTLTSLDLIFIIAYFLLVVLIAYVRSRKASAEEFLIAKRKLGVLSSLATINATKTGSILLIYTALIYSYGFSAIWFFLGVSTGYLIFIPFAVQLHKRHGKSHYTLAAYFFHSYGRVAGSCASILNIFIMLAWLMMNLIASSKVLSFFSGLSFEISTLIVMAFVLTYLLIGGFKAVVATDILQYFAIVFIFVVFSVVFSRSTSIAPGEWNLFGAGLQNILGFFLVGGLAPFAAPELWQRVYAIKNISTLKKSIFYSVLVYLFLAVVISFIGLSIKSAFPAIDPDIALIEGFARMLPAGLVGLAVVVFFAAFMSSIDTYTYTAASSIVQDFFQNLSKKETVRRIKIAVVGIVILGCVLAIAIQDLLLSAFIFASYVVVLAVPTLATWIRPQVKKRTISTSIVFGTIGLSIVTGMLVVQNNLTPLIVLIAIAISLSGLLVGALYSKFSAKTL